MASTPALTAEDYAFSRLIAYAAYQWPNYKDAPHHRLIARHLEAVERGDIKRLMITMPPRHGKSMLASEFFPAWYMGRNPDHYVVTATYAQELADDFGRKVKNQIEDEAYAAIFPGVGLADDSKSAKRFHIEGKTGGFEHATKQRGAFYAVGVGGPLTGRGAHLLLIDDPVKNREDADSEIMRRKIRDWYTSTAYTRLMPGGRVVIIQTRWHEADLAGWLLEEHKHEGWTVLDLPAINDDGEALWPEQYPVEDLQRIQRALPPRDWSALYMQRPAPDTGDYFKREWIIETDTTPPRETMQIFGASDYAVTADGGDYTVHVVMGIDHTGRLWLLDLWRQQASSDVWVDSLCALVRQWKPIGWAEETGQIKSGVGPFLVKRMLETEAYVAREQFPTRGDKAVRAQSIRGRMAMQGLHVPRGAPWLPALISEMMSFPVGSHDDQCVVPETLVATPDGDRRIIDIQRGDYVFTPAGPREVLESRVTTCSAKTVRVKFSNGAHVDCTPNHPVFVSGRGFVRADTLGIGDAVEVIGARLCVRDLQRVKWWNIGAIDTADTRTAKTALIPAIFMQLSRGVASCIAMFGRMSAGLSRKAAKFITSMKTRRTMRFPIFSALPALSTASATLCGAAPWRTSAGTFLKSDILPQSGMVQTRAENGTPRMEGSRGPIAALGLRFAKNAAKNIKRILSGRDSAVVHVLSVTEQSGLRPVCNLTVKGEHVYYANGILTHNCDALGLAGQLIAKMDFGATPEDAKPKPGAPPRVVADGVIAPPLRAQRKW